jgi:predicted transcriptional regulator
VSWELLAQLDTLTLEGLRSSVAQAISALEESGIASRRKLPRRTLRLVKGAA